MTNISHSYKVWNEWLFSEWILLQEMVPGPRLLLSPRWHYLLGLAVASRKGDSCKGHTLRFCSHFSGHNSVNWPYLLQGKLGNVVMFYAPEQRNQTWSLISQTLSQLISPEYCRTMTFRNCVKLLKSFPGVRMEVGWGGKYHKVNLIQKRHKYLHPASRNIKH